MVVLARGCGNEQDVVLHEEAHHLSFLKKPTVLFLPRQLHGGDTTVSSPPAHPAFRLTARWDPLDLLELPTYLNLHYPLG